MIDIEALRQINYVIEHDATSSTYKYVLLKSVISACQKYDHLITVHNDRAHIPLGVVVNQWISDYMPFVFKNISQQNNGSILDKPIIEKYENIFSLLELNKSQNWEYSYMQFIKASENLKMPPQLAKQFVQLSKKIAQKIVTMPMRYTGKKDYEIFSPENLTFGSVKLSTGESYSLNFLITSFGNFSISKQHYDVFRYLGQTLYGQSTIQAKWKAKTISLNRNDSTPRDIIDKLSSDEFETRDTKIIREHIQNVKECVWSGKPLSGKLYDVDHLLPYSVWFNNDLWNMLPTDRVINQQKKKHKIPSPDLIKKREDCIKSYWQQYFSQWPQQFKSQIEVSLTGANLVSDKLIDIALESLCKKCHYLIFDRGHEKFDL